MKKVKEKAKKTDRTRVKVCELSTEERLTIVANLLIDKLIDDNSSNLVYYRWLSRSRIQAELPDAENL